MNDWEVLSGADLHRNNLILKRKYFINKYHKDRRRFYLRTIKKFEYSIINHKELYPELYI